MGTNLYVRNLQELLEAISKMIKEEEDRVSRERKFLLGVKIEAIQPIADMLPAIETKVDVDLVDLLSE